MLSLFVLYSQQSRVVLQLQHPALLQDFMRVDEYWPYNFAH